MARSSGKPSAPELSDCPSLRAYPVFLRKVTRAKHWKDPCESDDATGASQVLLEDNGIVSVWFVSDDTDLRRVAIAMNEGRGSFHETLDLLPIQRDELKKIGVTASQTPGDTNCIAAQSLHHDIRLTKSTAVKLCELLIADDRKLERCKRGEMKQAETQSIEDGCFATVPESRSCACEATPQGN